MLFNSFAFPVFLAIVLGLFRVLPRARWRQGLLLVSSYVFYGWWDWRFTSLLLLSTIVAYVTARLMSIHTAEQVRKRLLALSVAVNLGLLGVFKYFNFFIDSFGSFAGQLGLTPHLPTLHIILPVGISFYTFQAMSYNIDVYQRRAAPEEDFIAFALYVSFFPQLVAGPIERPGRLLPQLKRLHLPDAATVERAAGMLLLGYAMKFILADFVSADVDRIFQSPDRWHSGTLLSGAYLFAIQIYGDFAGYSLIARGTALLFGVELMENFCRPYFAVNVTDFWHRWHISLSTWLRDYVYIAWLGGNRRGTARTMRNLWITMLLGGLWHGANWTYFVWGGIHAAALSLHKLWIYITESLRMPQPHTPRWSRLRRNTTALIGFLMTLHTVVLAWIFFRASSVTAAWLYLARLLQGTHIVRIMPLVAFAVVAMLLLEYVRLRVLTPQTPEAQTASQRVASAWLRGTVYGLLCVVCILFRPGTSVAFVYFQF